MKFSTSILASFAFVAAGAANATIVTAHDNFDGASAGWAGNWTLATGKNPAKPPAMIKESGASQALVITGNDDNVAVRTLETRQYADVFVDFTLQYSGTLGANDFVGLWFGNSNGPNIGLKANCGTTSSCTNDLFVRTVGSGGNYLFGSDLEAGKSYHVFGHLYKSGKNGDYYDRFDAWLKPSADELMSFKTPDAKMEIKSTMTSFTSLGFRSANIDSNVSVSIDNLRVANVPEPGSLALMGLAFAGLAAARRRKA